MRYAPWESYAQWAGVLAVEEARAARDERALVHYADLTAGAFGSRLREDLRARLEGRDDATEGPD